MKQLNNTPRHARLFRLFGFGAVACALTIAVGYAGFYFVRAIPTFIETQSLGPASLVLLLLNGAAAFAVFLWRDFYRTLMARVS